VTPVWFLPGKKSKFPKICYFRLNVAAFTCQKRPKATWPHATAEKRDMGHGNEIPLVEESDRPYARRNAGNAVGPRRRSGWMGGTLRGTGTGTGTEDALIFLPLEIRPEQFFTARFF